MNISEFLQSLPALKSENIRSTSHFSIRHEQRRDDSMPDIEEIKKMVINSKIVAVSEQDEDKFEIIFELNDDYDLVLVISIKNINPELIINLITCYKRDINRRVK